MAKIYNASIRNLYLSFTNESQFGYATSRSSNGLGAADMAFVTSLQTFPTWITNPIFNSIYAFGILTNIVLLAYLIYYKRYKTPVFCVILSLGVADLGVCIGCLLAYTVISPSMLVPFWVCNITIGMMYLSYLASSYQIAVFAVLRFLQLVYPLASRFKVTTSLLLKICLTIWSVHSIQAFILASYYQTRNVSTEGASERYMCFFMGDQRVLFLCIIIVWGAAPFLSTSGFHVAKQVVVVLSRSDTVTSHDGRSQRMRRETDSRALALVIMAYLVTVFPFILQSIRVHVLNVSYELIDMYLLDVFTQTAYSNSAINPWIYLFAAESVRSDVRKLVACQK